MTLRIDPKKCTLEHAQWQTGRESPDHLNGVVSRGLVRGDPGRRFRGGIPVHVEIRKQVSFFVPLSDWKAMRMEAARLGIPITELCRRWMREGMDELRERHARRVRG